MKKEDQTPQLPLRGFCVHERIMPPPDGGSRKRCPSLDKSGITYPSQLAESSLPRSGTFCVRAHTRIWLAAALERGLSQIVL